MGITDKKLKDKRFIKTERAILRALFSSKKILGVRTIIRRAKISRPTLYRHHKTIYGIVPDYEEYILKKYNRLIGNLIKRNNITVKVIYCQLLIFILKNKDIFRMIVDRGDLRTIERMIGKIDMMVIAECKLPKNHEIMMSIYRKEISGVVEGWIKSDFLECETNVLEDILYLTKTLRSRLLQVAK